MLTDSAMIQYLHPEVLLVLFSVFVFIGGTWNRTRLGWSTIAAVVVGFAALSLSRQVGVEGAYGTAGALIRDELSIGFRRVALLLCFLFVIFSTQADSGKLYPELLGALVLLFVGLMLVASAGDLTLLFLGLELISIPTYVLLFLSGDAQRSEEATLKYFFLSILSSGMMLFGFACLYGLAGETNLVAISAALRSPAPILFPYFYPVAVGLILVGLCFKIAAVPFHFYAPDVYQATTNLNAAVLAVVPKIAGVLAMVRILVVAVPHKSPFAWKLVLVLAVLTMTLGNVAALWQTQVRRMMAYSSIAHAGYLLIGLSTAMGLVGGQALGNAAIGATLLYVIVYSIASVGVFASLAYLNDPDQPCDTVDSLAGIGRLHPMIGGVCAISLFSLAGIPPLAGFWGKLTLFRSALDAGLQASDVSNRNWFLTLCILGVINAAIAAAYYLRLIAALYFQSSPEGTRIVPVAGHTGAGLAAMISGMFVLLIGVRTGGVLHETRNAADSLWSSSPVGVTASSVPAADRVLDLGTDDVLALDLESARVTSTAKR